MFRVGRGRASRRGRAGQQALDLGEGPGERVRLRLGNPSEELSDLRAEAALDRRERSAPLGGQGELEPAAIRPSGRPLHEAVPLEVGHQLGDGRSRDGRPPGEVGRGDRAVCDRPQREELRDRQRRAVGGEQPLDPSRGQGGGCDERVREVVRGFRLYRLSKLNR